MSQFPPNAPRGPQDPFAPQPKKGMGTGAIVAIIIGAVALVAIVCGGVLVAIMLPAMGKAREAARSIMASTNVRQLVMQVHTYAAENKDYLPPQEGWTAALDLYGPTAAFTDSPQIEGTGNEMVYSPPAPVAPATQARLDRVQFPAQWIIIREDETKLPPKKMVAVGYLDGSVRLISQAELAAALAQQKGQ